MTQNPNVTGDGYRGIFPIAPTPFTEEGELDLPGQRRVVDCMIDQGVDGICILANYSEQFLLTDRERDTLLNVCIDQVAGRVPVIATCSNFSTQIAAERARQAQAAGAAMVMMMPPYHGVGLKADEAGVCEHFSQVADAISIPIMVQDAPLSGVTLPVDLLARLAKASPQVSYFKIEVPYTADKLRSLIAAAPEAIVGPFDGENSITLLADLDAGATGTMSSALIPDLIKPVLEHHKSGRRDQAKAEYAQILPVINFENRQCELRAAKAAMMAGGVIKSDAVRHPLRPLHPATREELLNLLRPMYPVILRWGH